MIVLALFGGCLVNTELYERRLAELTADDTGGPDTDSRDTDVDDTDSGDTDSGDTDSGDTDSGDTDVPVTDADGDGYDAVAAGGDDCDDTDASVFPGAAETWADGFTDNDCDGEPGGGVLEYGGEVWEGWREGDLLGRRVAVLPDVDGDGLDEALIGSDYASPLGAFSGLVVAVSGPASGSLESARTLLPVEAGASMVANLDAGFDGTGDGVADLVVNAPGTGSSMGRAWVVDGAAWWAAGTADVEAVAAGAVTGSAAGTFGPTAARFVGDVDGDGIADIALSECCGDVGGSSSRGRVAIVSTDAFVGSIDDAGVVVDGPWDGVYLGGNLAPAGDQDGDGLDDVFLGSTGGLVASLIRGTESGALEDVAIALVYGEVSTGFGEVHNGGDLDGDGHDELIVTGDDVEQRLYVFTTVASAPTRSLDGPSFTLTWAEAGGVQRVLPLGDRDGDGREELFVPQYYATSGFQRAWVLPGAMVTFGGEVSTEDLDLEVVNVVPSTEAGASVALGDDIDGDGREDILVGTPGYSGGATEAGGAALVPVPR